MPQSHNKILLLGYGDIASRLVSALSTSDYCISAVRRTHIIETSSVRMYAADCANLGQLMPIIKNNYDVIVVTMTPDSYDEAGYVKAYVDTVQALVNSLEETKMLPKLILFVSSTSVYGQDNNQWVNELSVAEPQGYNGQILLKAESLLQSSQFNTCVVRFSGIYGPGRNRIIHGLLKGKRVPEFPVIYSNRIHSEDCAGVLKHLIEISSHKSLQSVYLATDHQPASSWQVQQWLLSELERCGADITGSVEYEPKTRTSRRFDNHLLLQTGYHFIHPDYRSGYSSVLDGMTFVKSK